MTELENPITKPERSARFVASKQMRFVLIGSLVFLVALVLWRMFAGGKDEKPIKSNAETQLEKIMDATNKEGKTPPESKTITGKGAEQPSGDPEALQVLNQAKADDDAKERRKMEAEQRMLTALAYQHYNRKIQGLKYDSELANQWERKITDSQRNGQAAPTPPTGPNPEDFETLKTTRPDLYAKWVSLRGGPQPYIAPGAPGAGGAIPTSTPAGQPNVTALAGSGLGQSMPKAVPVGIDPKTGLPTGVVMGDQSAVVYSLLDDGSPDIGNGAIPVQIQYVPPGATQAVTVIKWLRPGYLSGRTRPYDPMALKEEDESFRRSLKDSTEVPMDSATVGVSIPYRYSSAKTRVSQGGDFKFQNRYVVVLPNPDPNAQLTPANPPLHQ